jgi:hypothetical protein
MEIPRDIDPWEALYRYWLAKHVAGRPPARADIDPMIDVPHLAQNLIVIEYDAAGSRYRLVGSQVVRRFGADNTGKPVGSSGVEERQLKIWREAIETAARHGRPTLLASRYAGADRAKTVGLLLPLTPDADGVMKLLGGTFFDQPYPNADPYPELPVQELVLGT